MLTGAAAGAAVLQWSPTAVIALAAALAAAVGGVFTFVPRFRVSGSEAELRRSGDDA